MSEVVRAAGDVHPLLPSVLRDVLCACSAHCAGGVCPLTHARHGTLHVMFSGP
jgi:hypothetical protein